MHQNSKTITDSPYLHAGDDLADMKIYEIINRCFGKEYKGWMAAWYDIDKEYAAWFPRITKTDDRPRGSYGGTRSHSNTLSADGRTILEIDHETPSTAIIDIDPKYEKTRLVFGRMNGGFQFLGVFERHRVEDAELVTYRYDLIAEIIDLRTFSLYRRIK